MKKMLLKCCCVVLSLCPGCSSVSNDTGRGMNIAKNPEFTELEVRSKSWKDTLGQTIIFMNWSTVDFKSRGKLVIAEYGDPTNNIASCVEFYRITKAWVPNEEDRFILLAHDYMPSTVVSIEPSEHETNADIVIIRESLRNVANKHERIRYAWQVKKDYTMSMDLEIGEWSVP
jgi:hypothetical protein